MPDEESIFDEAVQIRDPHSRVEFLEQVCKGDTDLKNRVSSLLASHDNTSFILNHQDRVAELFRADDSKCEQAGSRIGPYKLLQQIGEGGMGLVFMAEQFEPIRRKVALKIIKSGMDSKQVIRRFEAERQALARMDHPNITRVIDAGVAPSGRLYFVMELVRGTSLTEYCDKNQIAIEQRLELFQRVCLAIHHAHQKGIIHRDIKPSNVMITLHDGVPVPKVIDFGIAKALDRPLTEKTLFTQYSELIGTPEYMSPEQAEMSGLDLDVRCDIYSLGVLLFELLTGSTPLQADSIKDQGLIKILETIREFEAETASARITQSGQPLDAIAKNRQTDGDALARFVKGDLDWIVAKALAKDRNRRYESAAAFGRDVKRFVKNEPVEAAAPTLAYKSRKFFVKHKVACTFAATLAAVLIVSTAASTYFAINAVSAQNKFKMQLAELTAEQKLSDERRIVAENAVIRAESAEAEAKQMGQERQNDAAISRAMARFTLEQAPPEIQLLVQGAIDRSESDGAGPILGFKTIHGPFLSERVSVAPGLPSKGAVPIGKTAKLEFLDRHDSRAQILNLILDEQRKEFGSDGLFVAETLFQLGELKMEMKQHESAELCLRESLALMQSSGESLNRVKDTLSAIIKCLEGQGKSSQSLEFKKRLDAKATQ